MQLFDAAHQHVIYVDELSGNIYICPQLTLRLLVLSSDHLLHIFLLNKKINK